MATIDYKQKIIDYMNSSEVDTLYRSMLNNLFPELKESEESEDERIRKAIHIYLDWLDGKKDYAPRGEYTINDMIDWIEKQGKHQKFRDSIQVGDKVTRNEDGVLVNLSQLARVAKPAKNQDVQQETLCGKCRKEQPSHSCQDITALGRCAVEHEQKPAEFDDANAKRMFIKALERVEEQNNKGYKLTDCDKNSWWEDFKAYCGYTEIQKPAWSEEDEEIYRKCICAMRASACGFPEEEKFVEQVDNWLKSLKDRYTWKPSGEQMKILNEVLNFAANHESPHWNDYIFGTLNNLIRQLKRLREE